MYTMFSIEEIKEYTKEVYTINVLIVVEHHWYNLCTSVRHVSDLGREKRKVFTMTYLA